MTMPTRRQELSEYDHARGEPPWAILAVGLVVIAVIAVIVLLI